MGPLGTQLAGWAKGGHAGKGGSKPGCGFNVAGERKTEWPEGTVMAWCPKCGATGKKSCNNHNHPRQQGEPLRSCGRY